jgi:hypothetical protein
MHMTGLIYIISLAAMLAGPQAPNADRHFSWHEAQAATPLQIPESVTPDTSAATGEQPSAEAPQPEIPTPEADQPAPEGPDATEAPPTGSEDEGTSPDDFSLGEIPVIETMELTPDIARRALDSYLLAREKYANSDLEQYENLQDFVDQTPDGKNFEADIKAAGFANVNDWNLAITTLGVIYGSVADDQSADLQQQIAEVEADTELAQDIKDRMVKALKAMIPSENNKKVVEELLADPVYGPKLKQLEIEEE